MIVNKNKTEPKRYFKERNVEKNYTNLIKIQQEKINLNNKNVIKLLTKLL